MELKAGEQREVTVLILPENVEDLSPVEFSRPQLKILGGPPKIRNTYTYLGMHTESTGEQFDCRVVGLRLDETT